MPKETCDDDDPQCLEQSPCPAPICLRLAAQLKDPELKSLFVELAAAWLELAERAGQRDPAPPEDSGSELTDGP
jgi:hypothetical protein